MVPRDKNEPSHLRVNKPHESRPLQSSSLRRFNIESTAECECGNRLQTEGRIFWDCKLYEDQRATMMDILSEKSKRECQKSVTKLFRLEEKRSVQGVCYFIKKIPKFI
jgi:hypothetical protein